MDKIRDYSEIQDAFKDTIDIDDLIFENETQDQSTK